MEGQRVFLTLKFGEIYGHSGEHILYISSYHYTYYRLVIKDLASKMLWIFKDLIHIQTPTVSSNNGLVTLNKFDQSLAFPLIIHGPGIENLIPNSDLSLEIILL